MPLSTYDGRQWVSERLAQTTAPVIVDAGAGAGTYSVLGRHLRWDAHWVGVEAHAPYVDRFLLDHLYDEVVVTDIRDYPPPGQPYVLLLGDVLEHLPHADAVAVLDRHKQHATEIMVSVPIVDSPQDECFDNPHEAHLYQWGYDEMAAQLPGAEGWRGVQVGRYWWRR